MCASILQELVNLTTAAVKAEMTVHVITAPTVIALVVKDGTRNVVYQISRLTYHKVLDGTHVMKVRISYLCVINPFLPILN